MGWRAAQEAITALVAQWDWIPGELRARIVDGLSRLPRPPNLFQKPPPSISELGERYGLCERAVSYWRQAGCPFHKGPQSVVKWAVENQKIAPGFQARFAQHIKRERVSKLIRDANRALAQLRREMPKGIRAMKGATVA